LFQLCVFCELFSCWLCHQEAASHSSGFCLVSSTLHPQTLTRSKEFLNPVPESDGLLAFMKIKLTYHDPEILFFSP
jgi:hypothetical protein